MLIFMGYNFFNVKVAERVATERAEACGNGKSTGYQIRLERYLVVIFVYLKQ